MMRRHVAAAKQAYRSVGSFRSGCNSRTQADERLPWPGAALQCAAGAQRPAMPDRHASAPAQKVSFPMIPNDAPFVLGPSLHLEGAAHGPLAGLNFGVKDLIDVAACP